MTLEAEQAQRQRCWHTLCGHLDALALAPVAFALERCGLLAALRASAAPLELSDLARRFALRPGYLQVAARQLELQGLALRSGRLGLGEVALALTPAGRDWAVGAGRYRAAPDAIAAARALGAALAEGGAAPRAPEVAPELQAPLVAAALAAIARHDLAERLPGAAPGSALAAAALLLSALGWTRAAGAGWAWTPEGRIALAMAPQYFYPVGYLPLLAALPRLLAGEPVPELQGGQEEGHVDRALDIRFSGLVYRRSARAPFLEVALPLFEAEPLAAQPRAVVDTGCGDGTLLIDLYEAVRAGTARGAALERHPLVMVGVEYNAVAGRIAGERLAAAGIPHLLLEGDIGAPQALCRRLAEAGIEPAAVLHVSKSTIHDRAFRGAAPPVAEPLSAGAFAAEDGGAIAPAALEADLAEFFGRWRACLGPAGMIAVEAHLLEAAQVAARIGRTPIPATELTHGFSHQYLLEWPAYRRAAESAGLRLAERREVGREQFGGILLSVCRFLA